MTIDTIKKILSETVSEITFTYKGKSCGIDPFVTHYILWYGENDETFNKLEELFNYRMFEGKTLMECINDCNDWEPNM